MTTHTLNLPAPLARHYAQPECRVMLVPMEPQPELLANPHRNDGRGWWAIADGIGYTDAWISDQAPPDGLCPYQPGDVVRWHYKREYVDDSQPGASHLVKSFRVAERTIAKVGGAKEAERLTWSADPTDWKLLDVIKAAYSDAVPPWWWWLEVSA